MVSFTGFPLPKPDESTIRVVLADEMALFRRQLLVSLEQSPDIEVLSEAADSDTLVARALELAPDVVITAMRLPGSGGVRAAAKISARLPGTGVVMIATADDADDVVRAVKAGATGFVAREAAVAQASLAARAVARGRCAISAPVADAVLAEFASLERQVGSVQQSLDPPHLDAVEENLLGKVAAGSSLAEAAEDLGVTLSTGQNLLANALRKLHRHARTEVALYQLDARRRAVA